MQSVLAAARTKADSTCLVHLHHDSHCFRAQVASHRVYVSLDLPVSGLTVFISSIVRTLQVLQWRVSVGAGPRSGLRSVFFCVVWGVFWVAGWGGGFGGGGEGKQ